MRKSDVFHAVCGILYANMADYAHITACMSINSSICAVNVKNQKSSKHLNVSYQVYIIHSEMSSALKSSTHIDPICVKDRVNIGE